MKPALTNLPIPRTVYTNLEIILLAGVVIQIQNQQALANELATFEHEMKELGFAVVTTKDLPDQITCKFIHPDNIYQNK